MKNLVAILHRNRRFLYCLLCAFISVGALGQRQLDTVDVVILVCDTTEQYYVDLKFTHGEIIDGQYVDYFERDTICTGNRSHEIWWRFGKEVLELHNTAEGQIDPGSCPSCWHDYWVHKEYLDETGYKLPKGLIVWQAVRRK